MVTTFANRVRNNEFQPEGSYYLYKVDFSTLFLVIFYLNIFLDGVRWGGSAFVSRVQ